MNLIKPLYYRERRANIKLTQQHSHHSNCSYRLAGPHYGRLSVKAAVHWAEETTIFSQHSCNCQAKILLRLVFIIQCNGFGAGCIRFLVVFVISTRHRLTQYFNVTEFRTKAILEYFSRLFKKSLIFMEFENS